MGQPILNVVIAVIAGNAGKTGNVSIGKQLLDDPNVAAMARAGMAASSKVISNQ
jgi:hypothetical protein